MPEVRLWLYRCSGTLRQRGGVPGGEQRGQQAIRPCPHARGHTRSTGPGACRLDPNCAGATPAVCTPMAWRTDKTGTWKDPSAPRTAPGQDSRTAPETTPAWDQTGPQPPREPLRITPRLHQNHTTLTLGRAQNNRLLPDTPRTPTGKLLRKNLTGTGNRLEISAWHPERPQKGEVGSRDQNQVKTALAPTRGWPPAGRSVTRHACELAWQRDQEQAEVWRSAAAPGAAHRQPLWLPQE